MAESLRRKEYSLFRIEVSVKDGFTDPGAEALQKDIHDLGITSVERVSASDIYLLEGKPDQAALDIICQELLTDPIVEGYSYRDASSP